jgi:ABC-2 type transport system ATP-binding protein
MTTQQVQAIHVQGLEKSYKQLQVLRGVDFDVARGSIFALLGSNGAGKTTVVKILSTLLKADAGTASVNGFDVATQAGDVRESISLTGQFTAVDEILSGRENLVLVAKLRHLKNPGKIAGDLLERFALTDAAARKVSTYSGGMRRRLDIAMSLIGNADHLPRRTDDRARPTGAHRGVAGHQGTRRARHDGAARHSIWTRPNNSPTGSPSSTRVGSS